MATYDLSGEFYEACDCEVICSCWAGLPPEMGSCTGLFIWDIKTGTVNGMDVNGSKVAVLSSGKSCDISKYMLVLINGVHQLELENAFTESGAWHDVFQAQSFAPDTQRSVKEAKKIEIIDDGTKITVHVESKDLNIVTKTELSFTLQKAQIVGQNMGTLLVDRVVGTAANKSISVGVVDTPIDETKNGLNLLADIPGYTFDLDVSRVTAMRGNFHYTN